MYILLDHDSAGIDARNEIINGEAYKSRQHSLSMKIANIQPSDPVITLYHQKIKFLFEIEHLCAAPVWELWKSQGLVTLRDDSEIRNMFDGLIPRDKSLDNVIDELVDNIGVRDTILTFEPKKLKKKQMVACLKSHFYEDASMFSGFERTIKDIEAFFCK